MQNLINQIGIVLNIIGTLLVAFSFGKPPSTAEQWDKKGRKVSLAAFLYPKWFTIGIILLVMGFISMFVSTLIK